MDADGHVDEYEDDGDEDDDADDDDVDDDDDEHDDDEDDDDGKDYFFMARTTYVCYFAYVLTLLQAWWTQHQRKAMQPHPCTYVDLALAGSLTSKANCRESRAAANSGDQLRKHSCTCRN